MSFEKSENIECEGTSELSEVLIKKIIKAMNLDKDITMKVTNYRNKAPEGFYFWRVNFPASPARIEQVAGTEGYRSVAF